MYFPESRPHHIFPLINRARIGWIFLKFDTFKCILTEVFFCKLLELAVKVGAPVGRSVNFEVIPKLFSAFLTLMPWQQLCETKDQQFRLHKCLSTKYWLVTCRQNERQKSLPNKQILILFRSNARLKCSVCVAVWACFRRVINEYLGFWWYFLTCATIF